MDPRQLVGWETAGLPVPLGKACKLLTDHLITGEAEQLKRPEPALEKVVRFKSNNPYTYLYLSVVYLVGTLRVSRLPYG